MHLYTYAYTKQYFSQPPSMDCKCCGSRHCSAERPLTSGCAGDMVQVLDLQACSVNVDRASHNLSPQLWHQVCTTRVCTKARSHSILKTRLNPEVLNTRRGRWVTAQTGSGVYLSVTFSFIPFLKRLLLPPAGKTSLHDTLNKSNKSSKEPVPFSHCAGNRRNSIQLINLKVCAVL